MSSKTKIVVLRMKEIIYTAIFIGLAIFLILLFFFMFRSEKKLRLPLPKALPRPFMRRESTRPPYPWAART